MNIDTVGQYYANDLGSQMHSMVISSDQESNTGKFLDIDAVTVLSAENQGADGGVSSLSAP